MRRVLLAALLLGSCGGEVPIEVTPPTWERTGGSGDDDDVAGDATITVSPDAVQAGAVVDVAIDLENFAFDGTTAPCCAPDDVLLLGNGEGDGLVLRLFFGLELQGTVPWGMSGLTETAETSFEVAPRPAFDALAAPADRAIDLAVPGAFTLHSLAVTEPNTMVAARVRDTGAPFFRPSLWWLADDGFTTWAQGGFRRQGDLYDPPRAMFFAEPGDYRLRVGDANGNGGAGYTGTLDVATLTVNPPTDVLEAEPNDAFGQWQELSVLEAGRHTLTGIAAVPGHDELDNPNGDLEVFVFSLAQASTVTFRLDWRSVLEDFDAVVYDGSNGEVALTFDSPDAIDVELLAGRAQPETGSLELLPDTPYVLMIANWQGSFDQDWAMTIDVMPDPWADAAE